MHWDYSDIRPTLPPKQLMNLGRMLRRSSAVGRPKVEILQTPASRRQLTRHAGQGTGTMKATTGRYPYGVHCRRDALHTLTAFVQRGNCRWTCVTPSCSSVVSHAAATARRWMRKASQLRHAAADVRTTEFRNVSGMVRRCP